MLRFACTQCGKCCNRSPEVELSEAAPLADVFVFRLMFRLYSLPNQLSDFAAESETGNRSAAFYERKRLLAAFAARKIPVRVRRNGRTADHTKYLMISALALDTSRSACSALSGTRCGIHERRPLSCRSVPFHYSRGETSAEADLAAFVATPGFQCDTSDAADVVMAAGRIVAPDYADVRKRAIALAGSDRAWATAIVRRMKGTPAGTCLPTLEEIEANAQFAATTVSMRVAWQIGADAGLVARAECERLTELQLHAIGQALADGRCSAVSRQTLMEMQTEYRQELRSPATLEVRQEASR